MTGQLRLFPVTPYRTPAAPQAVADVCDPAVLVTRTRIGKLDDLQAAACAQLTLPTGSMRSEFQWLRAAAIQRPRSRSARSEVIMLRRDERLCAWALVQPRRRELTVAYLYVAEDCRREGLGRILVRQTLAAWPQARFCPWDERSLRFFEACGPLPYTPSGQRYATTDAAPLAA